MKVYSIEKEVSVSFPTEGFKVYKCPDRWFIDGEKAYKEAKDLRGTLKEWVSHDGEFALNKTWEWTELEKTSSINDLTDPRITLQDLVETIEPIEPFKPLMWHSEDGDFLEYCFSPEPSYGKQLLPFLVTFYGEESGELTAFQIHGATKRTFDWLATALEKMYDEKALKTDKIEHLRELCLKLRKS